MEKEILNAIQNRLTIRLKSEQKEFQLYLEEHGLSPWVCSWHIANDIGQPTSKVKYRLEKLAKEGKIYRTKHCGGAVGFTSLELEGMVFRDGRFWIN